MENKNLKAKLEALLFVLAEPIALKKLGELLKVDEETLKNELAALKEDLNDENRGLWITEIGNQVQLTTKPDFSHLLEEVMKGELTEELTPSSLETLSIIAYLGPVTRAMVEYIRGVNSSFIIRSLLLRGLIQRLEEKKSNAYLYDLSFEFLRRLGLSDKGKLPDYEKYHDLMKMLNNEAGLQD